MNVADARAWMEAGFLAVEGVMATEIATARQLSMSEDFIRGAMLRGLLMSKHNDKGDKGTILREYMPSWAKAPCWKNVTHKQGKGRKPQHDVAIVRVPSQTNAADIPLVVCEAKWIKKASARSAELVAKDIWKVAFTMSVSPPGTACKGYLLIGGEDTALSGTLDLLRPSARMSWSAAGQPPIHTQNPQINLGGLYRHALGGAAFVSLLKWGNVPHYRTPRPVWWHLWADCAHTWVRTTRDGVSWRIALWELHHRAMNDSDEIDWPGSAATFAFVC